jgi:hypothetical protein
MNAPGENFVDQNLKLFSQRNQHCKITLLESEISIDAPWGSDDCRLIFDIEEDKGIITQLNDVVIDPRFDAIIHAEKRTIEFIYGYLIPDAKYTKDIIDREFLIHFMGAEYKCHFGKPSDYVYSIAKGFKRLPSDKGVNSVPQLLAYRDAQRLDKLTERNRKYFENRVPRNFFVQIPTNIDSIDLLQLVKHINFIMHYYDRYSPQIIIRSEDIEYEKHFMLRYCENNFPPSIVLRTLDEVILRLIDVAGNSNPRYAFIYYYQVFEYAGYYYLDEKVKRRLTKLLRNPTVINCSDEAIGDVIEIISDYAHSDETKMRKVIEDICCPRGLWKEIEHDKQFFASSHICDGSFTIPALISADTTEASWVAMWTPKLFDHLTKIRNCLVHAREKRESKIILPTARNNRIIERYKPIIARMADQLAIGG